MANYNKSFNFRNGVQVDNDNFIVNANGLVGIGTSIPVGAILDVYGDVKVSGFLTASSLRAKSFSVSGVTSFSTLNVGITSITSGIITASSGIITYYGDGSKLSNLPTSQWTTSSGNIYSTVNVGIATTNPVFAFQVGPNPLTASTGFGINSTGNVYSIGVITAASFTGDGSNLSALDASNITSGTLINSVFPTNVTLSGILTAASFAGSGSSITDINASNITSGTLSASRLPSNISAGIVTATTFVGNLTGTATTASSLSATGSISVSSVNSGFTSTGIATVTDNLFVIGKLGIGTNSTPTSDIEINKSGISSISVISANNVATIGIGRSAEIRTGNRDISYVFSSPVSLDIINSNSGNVNYYLDYGVAGLNTGGFHWIYGQTPLSPLMSLTYDGRLGLGITNPPSKLYVVGSSYITGITTIDNVLSVSNDVNVGGNITFNGSITGNLGITTLSRLGVSTSSISGNSYEFFVGGDPAFGDGVYITKTDVRASGNIRSKTITVDDITCNRVNSTGIVTSASGFTSGIGVTDPVQITVSGNTLTFNVVGVGSTSLTLY